METEFIYWRHPTAPGIKVEEVSGADDRSGNLWLQMAKQVYCENGKDGFRQIGHYRNGSPFLEGEDCRISVTHTDHLLAVATLPRTPESDLRVFSPRTAMGIDAERTDREQVLGLRERFLNSAELESIPSENTEANILAWTIKEAAYKAALCPGLDFRSAIRIKRMPRINEAVAGKEAGGYGLVEVDRKEEGTFEFELFSWRSDECIITLAYSPTCAKWKGSSAQGKK